MSDTFDDFLPDQPEQQQDNAFGDDDGGAPIALGPPSVFASSPAHAPASSSSTMPDVLATTATSNRQQQGV
jgi:hypothetical protein